MSSNESAARQTKPTIDDVRNFWDSNPLFTGESAGEVGAKEWFDEHERVFQLDCINEGNEEIYTKGLEPESTILDVGCGPGVWVRYFLKRGFKNVSACDLTPTAVELTKKSLALYGLETNGSIMEGNAENLPFADESFDHVNCQGVIHHTPDTGKCIEEFHRVLKPGGTVCFSVYYKNLVLQHPFLFKAVTVLLRNFVKMQGRGRERMLFVSGADELVRLYDGVNNPIGKAYSRPEVAALVKDKFQTDMINRTVFPSRSMPVKIPAFIKDYIKRNFGLLIIFRCTKRPI